MVTVRWETRSARGIDFGIYVELPPSRTSADEFARFVSPSKSPFVSTTSRRSSFVFFPSSIKSQVLSLQVGRALSLSCEQSAKPTHHSTLSIQSNRRSQARCSQARRWLSTTFMPSSDPSPTSPSSTSRLQPPPSTPLSMITLCRPPRHGHKIYPFLANQSRAKHRSSACEDRCELWCVRTSLSPSFVFRCVVLFVFAQQRSNAYIYLLPFQGCFQLSQRVRISQNKGESRGCIHPIHQANRFLSPVEE